VLQGILDDSIKNITSKDMETFPLKKKLDDFMYNTQKGG
jgi:hypothetical protein